MIALIYNPSFDPMVASTGIAQREFSTANEPQHGFFHKEIAAVNRGAQYSDPANQ